MTGRVRTARLASAHAKPTEFVETNGARIAYDVEGEGPAVVLIHAGVANRSMWDAQVAALKDAYRVIRYDTRGFGETETDAVTFSNRADIAALLHHLGERSAHVLGLSRGAQIALDFALEYPDRVRSLIVAAGGIGGYESPDDAEPPDWQQVEAWIDSREWDPVSEWETAYWADGPGQPTVRVPEVRAKVHEWVLANYRAEKEEGTPQPLDPGPPLDGWGSLRAPLLAMLGTLDDAGTQESMRHLAESIPGARLEVFEGAAHMINLEQPERFNSLVREFLNRAS